MNTVKIIEVLDNCTGLLDRIKTEGIMNAAHIVNIYNGIASVKTELQKEGEDAPAETA